MSVIIYMHSGDQAVKERLVMIVQSVPLSVQLEVFQDFPLLQDRVCSQPKDIDAAIFFSQDVEGLRRLAGLNERFKGVPVILVLPDLRKTTFFLASMLNPVFTSTVDSDFSDIGAVLESIIGHRGKLFYPGEPFNRDLAKFFMQPGDM